MVDGISTSLAGLRDATQRYSNSARNIANAATPPKAGQPATNLDSDIVESVLASVQYKANAKVLKAQLDTQKHLLDILA